MTGVTVFVSADAEDQVEKMMHNHSEDLCINRSPMKRKCSLPDLHLHGELTDEEEDEEEERCHSTEEESPMITLCHEQRQICTSPDSVVDGPTPSAASQKEELVPVAVDPGEKIPLVDCLIPSASKEEVTPEVVDHAENISLVDGPTPSKPQKDELVPVVDDHSEYISLTQDDDFEESLSYFAATFRRVHFADEVGLALKQIHILEPHDAATSRIVVLLLSPKERVFEFLHAEYPRDPATTVQVLLEQIPEIATNPVFQTKTFSSISKTKNKAELRLWGPLQDCDLEESELVLGILEGFTANDIANFALPLLVNGKIIKAVSFRE
jgi:hypothetical protein